MKEQLSIFDMMTAKTTTEALTWHNLAECPGDLPKWEKIPGLGGLDELDDVYIIRTRVHSDLKESNFYEAVHYYGYWQDFRGYRFNDCDVEEWAKIERNSKPPKMYDVEEMQEALNVMCERCINHEVCMGTGYRPRRQLQDLING